MDGEITGEELRSLLDAGEDGGGTGDATDGAEGDEDALSEAATDDDLRIVDIRDPDAFERGHIPGSENVPAPELTDRVEELDGADRVVTVCPHGQASVQAARLVGAYRGVEGPVESLRGGLEAWDGPLTETDSAEGATLDDDPAGDESPAPF